MPEVHKDDVGTQFIVTIVDGDSAAIDISAATTKSIIFKKPSGTTSTNTASLITDGTDGKIYYVTQDSDLDEIGIWKIQAHIITPITNWHTNFIAFRVNRNL